jgi:proteic killer suppression protein
MDLIEAKGKAILMEVEFDDEDLDRLETDPQFTAGYAQEIVRAFRMRMQQIRSAIDERDFYNLKSLRFEKLWGDREGQHSIRLNSQWRLILKFRGKSPCKVVGIIEIVDYH